ncbi:MAG TPA: DUF3109 family protein [Bacteroidales bacterium]|nr:DUF3109 family protein [Bacteroidales bacterium]
MLIIDDIMVSDDLYLVKFVCPVQKCYGACCVEGDAGAPLEEAEISHLEDYLDEIKAYMIPEGIETVNRTGVFDYDIEGTFVTPLIRGGDCAFINFTDKIAWCSIEKAYEEGKIPFRKPVSCHLYPVRLARVGKTDAVNYHRWQICDVALEKGREVGIPLYVFLKDALIRKYGEAWYRKLDEEIKKIIKGGTVHGN